jgi:hypothetical protein
MLVESHPETVISGDDATNDEEGSLQIPAEISNAAARSSTVQPTTRESREGRRKKVKGNSVTKQFDTQEADKQYLMTVYDSSTLVHDVTKYLKAGTVMLKHGRSGKPHNRLFWIATVSFRVELIWVDPDNKTGSRSSIPLSDVSYVSLGACSKVFKRHPIPQAHKDFFLSFTIGLKDGGRTLDIVTSTLPDFEAWTIGICHLVQVDPHWGRALDISREEGVKLLSTAERDLCAQNVITPLDYLKVKEKVLKIRDEVLMHLRLFGNDPEQAYVSLGGIHLPQVSDKGAILMTKGELRYHCSPFNLDIFRVCKMWRVLADQNIVYDPAFVPATNFGVTHKL